MKMKVNKLTKSTKFALEIEKLRNPQQITIEGI